MSVQIGGQCKDCVWWESDNESVGSCRQCSNMKTESGVDFSPGSLAKAMSDGNNSMLIVSRFFGCVMFEALGKGGE